MLHRKTRRNTEGVSQNESRYPLCHVRRLMKHILCASSIQIKKPFRYVGMAFKVLKKSIENQRLSLYSPL